jgi:hypothetical protein
LLEATSKLAPKLEVANNGYDPSAIHAFPFPPGASPCPDEIFSQLGRFLATKFLPPSVVRKSRFDVHKYPTELSKNFTPYGEICDQRLDEYRVQLLPAFVVW